MAQIIIHAFMVVLFAVLGILCLSGKGGFLIRDNKSKNSGQRDDYDEKAAMRFMGKIMFGIALCWCPALIGAILHREFLYWICLALICILLFISVIYTTTGNRFKK